MKSVDFGAHSQSKNLCNPQSFSRRYAFRMIAGCVGLAINGLTACNRTPDRPWKGSQFPMFTLPAPDGTLHDSHQYMGRPLLINFWATWCPPCRAEMTDLNSLYTALGPKGLQLLGISVDTDLNLVREYQRQASLEFTVLIDHAQQWSASALQVPGFPTTYLVGRDGTIRDAWVGPRAWSDSGMQNLIAANMEK